MKTLFVICARKGSKRLKGKHRKALPTHGSFAPMWKFACDEVIGYLRQNRRNRGWAVFSSDDRKIRLRIPWAYCIVWVDRPKDLCSDETPIHKVLQSAVKETGLYAPDAVAFIPANVPTVTAKLINKCVRHLERNQKFSSVITVRTMRDHPEWAWKSPESPESFGGVLVPAFDRTTEYRIQGLPTRYVATGSVSIVRTPVLMSCNSAAAFDYLGSNIGFVLDEDAIEVHDKRDLELARAYLAYRERNGNKT